MPLLGKFLSLSSIVLLLITLPASRLAITARRIGDRWRGRRALLRALLELERWLFPEIMLALRLLEVLTCSVYPLVRHEFYRETSVLDFLTS